MLKASCRDKKYCRISLPIHNAIVFSKRQCKKDPIGDVALGTDKSILIIIGSKGFVNGKFEVIKILIFINQENKGKKVKNYCVFCKNKFSSCKPIDKELTIRYNGNIDSKGVDGFKTKPLTPFFVFQKC